MSIRADVVLGVTGLTRLLSGDVLAPAKLFGSTVWDAQGENCKKDVSRMVEGLKSSEFWSYSILDASSKLPTGILTGNIVDLGNFDECVQVRFPNASTQGQHCLASFSLDNSRARDDTVQVFPSLLLSFCIPSSCRAEALQNVLNSTWFPLTGGEATVADADCHVSESANHFSAEDIFSITLCVLVLLICIASTLCDTSAHHFGSKNGFLRSFSFLSNGKKLLQVSQNSDTMRPLNGIRFLSIAWIILGHRYFFMTTSPIMNLLEVPELIKKVNYQLIAGAILAVDTFFFLSGLLNAYHLMKALDRFRTFPIFKYYVHRYIRTTPALAIMILVYATWYIQTGDGPLWNRTVAPWKQFCVENWWSTLLYINNYYNPTTQCAGQSWYLAVDMQLYWVAPLIVVPCWRWPKISKYYLSFLLLLSTAGQFAVAYINKIRMSFSISQNLDEYLRVTEDIYVPTHTRASPYIMGVMLGLFLYRLRKCNRRLSVTKWMVLCGWLISTALCLSVLLGNYPFMQSESEHPYNRLESSFYISLHRIAWGAGLSWIIFATLYGYGGPVTPLLSWNGFVPLSRLTYCIFLTHLAVQQYQLGTVRTSSYYQDFDQVHRFFGDLAMTIITSTILCLMFESPIVMIEKNIENCRRKDIQEEGENNEGYTEEKLEKSKNVCKI